MTKLRSSHPNPRRAAIAIFGGTFDPIHSGHLAIARAALKRFQLSKIYFIPSSRPPHKEFEALAPFHHRYAMVALACAGERRFVPSLAEGPGESSAGIPLAASSPQYSIDTVTKFRAAHRKERIYFIVGADSFLDIGKWKSAEALLDSCDFIIASRPGFPLAKLRDAVPSEMLAPSQPTAREAIALRNSTAHLLTAVHSSASSTEIRRRQNLGRSIRGLVPAAVEDYILKQALYR